MIRLEPGHLRLDAGGALLYISDPQPPPAGVAVRYKTDGQELDWAGVIYLLQKIDGTWKIAVIVVHDADSRPLFHS